MAYKDLEKQRNFQTSWRTQWKDAWFAKHGPCSKCGSERNLRILSYTTQIPKNLWSRSYKIREEVLSQCVVLCSSCHRNASLKRVKERNVVKPLNNSPSEIMTVTDAARLLKVGRTTAYKLIEMGQLPAFKLGERMRVRRRDLQALLDGHQPLDHTAELEAAVSQAVTFDPQQISAEGKEVVITVTIKVV